MRRIALETIQERKLKVLSAIIHHYVKTAKPVGSNVLIEEYGIELSPAAVRNVMAELEKDDFLTHPHTSAGRVPTDKGYRTYVDSIAKLQQFAIEEEERLRIEHEKKTKEIEIVLSETSRILSGLSQYTGFVMAPKARYDEIKTIELVPVSDDELLVILVTRMGTIKHKTMEAFLPQSQLGQLRNFLNEKLRGVQLAEANKRIIEEIKDFRENRDNMLDIAQKVCDIFYDIRDDVYIDGTTNAIAREIGLPDFDDFGSIKSLIRFNENKEKLIEIINKDFDERVKSDLDDSGVNVTIGSENSVQELKDLSLVTTVYKDREKAVGVLGIIGPKRMEYEKMMSLVNSVSEMLNEFLRDRSSVRDRSSKGG
jgi:heat-inducible transcriptional repressor